MPIPVDPAIDVRSQQGRWQQHCDDDKRQSAPDGQVVEMHDRLIFESGRAQRRLGLNVKGLTALT